MSTKLSDRMREDLRIRNYAPTTQKIYLARVAKFVAHFGNRPPAQLGAEHIRAYQVYLVDERKCSWSMLNQTVCALKFFYQQTLGMEWTVKHIPYAKGEQKLPVPLSQGEAKKLLQATNNMKHLTMILLAYSGGLRVSEIANVELKDLDSDRMIIHVRKGKGRKDRIVPLSPVLLAIAREHWLLERSRKFLLSGQDPSRAISVATIESVVKGHAKSAGITKRVTPHILRHSFATHHLEGGTDLPTLQRLMGHSSIKSTLIYLHISTDKIIAAKTPLELLSDFDE